MKKIFILFCLLLAPHLKAQWIPQNSGTTEQLNDVYCITADTVVVVGNNATILRTTDGGTTWNAIANPATGNLTRVQFADNQTGYAIGDNSTLLKTTDGGQTWQSLNAGTTENLQALSCIDADTLYVGGTNGLIQKSTDGGNSWVILNQVYNYTIIDIDKIGTSDIFAISYNANDDLLFFKSNDSGVNWYLNSLSTGGSLYKDLFISNSNEIFTGALLTGLLSTDLGNTFTGVVLNDIGTINSISKTSDYLWSTGIDQRVSGNTSWGYITAISTQTGNPINSFYDNAYFNTIKFANDTTGYVVGLNGTILKNSTGINTVGIEQNIKNPFQIYPNPVTNYIHIQWEENNTKPIQYQITNLQGQVLHDFSHLKNNIIPVENLPQGLYLLQVQIDNKLYLQKFLKQ